MKSKKMFFGKKLKELRVYKTKKGLRNFAKLLEMKPSELSSIEHGYSPPRGEEWFWQVVKHLDLPAEESLEIIELAQLYRAPFVQEEGPSEFFPAFVCTTHGKPLSSSELNALTEYIKKHTN